MKSPRPFCERGRDVQTSRLERCRLILSSAQINHAVRNAACGRKRRGRGWDGKDRIAVQTIAKRACRRPLVPRQRGYPQGASLRQDGFIAHFTDHQSLSSRRLSLWKSYSMRHPNDTNNSPRTNMPFRKRPSRSTLEIALKPTCRGGVFKPDRYDHPPRTMLVRMYRLASIMLEQAPWNVLGQAGVVFLGMG